MYEYYIFNKNISHCSFPVMICDLCITVRFQLSVKCQVNSSCCEALFKVKAISSDAAHLLCIQIWQITFLASIVGHQHLKSCGNLSISLAKKKKKKIIHFYHKHSTILGQLDFSFIFIFRNKDLVHS